MRGMARPIKGAAVMGKKKDSSGGRPGVGRQINFRAPPDLVQRLETVAEALALDVSSLIRMVLAENLARYERRADEVLRERRPGPDS